MSSESATNQRTAQPALYIVIALGLIMIAVLAGVSWRSGGLPGTKDSPSATVHGQSTTGKSAAD